MKKLIFLLPLLLIAADTPETKKPKQTNWEHWFKYFQIESQTKDQKALWDAYQARLRDQMKILTDDCEKEFGKGWQPNIDPKDGSPMCQKYPEPKKGK